MKTRVIQDEPEPTHREPTGGAADAESKRPTNLAGRMGRWSARHRKTAIFGWLAFVVLAFAAGIVSGTTKIDEATSGVGESGRVDKLLHEEFVQPAGESVLVQSETLTVQDPAFAAAVEDVVGKVSALEVVTNVRSPLDPENSGQIGQNGRAALIDFDIRGDPDDAKTKIDPVVAAVDEAQKAHPELFIDSFGVSADKEIDAVVHGRSQEGWAPLDPADADHPHRRLRGAGGGRHPAPPGAHRDRCDVRAGRAPERAHPDRRDHLRAHPPDRARGRSRLLDVLLEAGARGAGRRAQRGGGARSGRGDVGPLGADLRPDRHRRDVWDVPRRDPGNVGLRRGHHPRGRGSHARVADRPAGHALLARRPGRSRARPVRRAGSGATTVRGRIWGAIVTAVMRRPVVSVVLAGGLLLALAVPALQLRTIQPAIETFPQSLPAIQTYNRIQAAFPGSEIPAEVVVQAADVNAPRVQEAIGQLEWRALQSGQLHEPITVDVNEAGTVANVAIPVDGKGMDATSEAALATLREDIVPSTVGALPNAEVGVTGMTAQSKDFNDKLASVAPLVFGFVLLLAFGLMLVAFRSLVIAFKAIILNLVSIAAAYGVMVLVFQHGFGKGILGFESTAGIDAFLPIFMFVILFGLSMDYHVFIISRIREAYDRGMSTEQAITYGIKTTAGVVTSAALVMVCVFAVFATLSLLIFKQFGVGLAAAILIDATIVRAILLPATMKLLGDWNWYLPKWLEWLPHLDHGEGVEPVKAPPVPTPSA